MKIRQLHINRFGHFNECDLVFPGDGLQVIYGPNEAGKTTLLEFLRGLLFDFPARTPYDFGGHGEMAGVATLELKDGRSVELRRRKGTKDKVAIKLDGQATELNDAGWFRMLDHADRGLFESVFAFGLDQLSQGEASLKHASLQSALFGGGGGTSSPDKVITELSRQADELFKKGGSKPAINALLAELKKLSKEIKDGLLRPEKFREAQTAVVSATDRAQSLNGQVDQLRRDHSRIEKQVRAWPKWWALQQRRGERSGLSVPESLPADARQQYSVVGNDLRSIANEHAVQLSEIETTEQSLAALKLDPGAVSYRAAIKSCVELRRSFIEAKEDLPERQRQREDTRRLIDRELAELCPGWNHEDLQAFSVDLATRTQIDRMSDERRDRTSTRTTLTAKRDSDAENLERSRDDLAEIGLSRDVTALIAVLADEADFAANRKHLQGIQSELAKLERKLATQIRTLVPPVSAAEVDPNEPVPRAETVAEFEARFTDLREQLSTAKTSVEDDELEYREIETSLATKTSNRVVPSLDERNAARERRDAGWGLVRRTYIMGELADSAVAAWLEEDAGTSLPDAYERAVHFADGIADEIYDNASEVAAREALRHKLAVLASRLDQKRQRIAELERQQAALQANWRALWQPCGFEPLIPSAMLGWLKDRAAACTTITERDELTIELAQLGERIASFEQRLRTACGLPDDDVQVLLTSAKQSVQEAKDHQRRTVDLQKEVRRLDKQLAKYNNDLQILADCSAAADVEWGLVLNSLDLPTEWDTEFTREVIDKLNATRVRLDSLPGEDARIIAMQTRVDEFEQRVRLLCEALEPKLLRDPAELAIEKLSEQVEQAVEAQRQHDGLSKALSAAREQLKLLNDRHNTCESERARWFALAEVANETALLEVITLAEKLTQLDVEIEQLQREVALIRAGDDHTEFESSLAHSELAVLEGEKSDLGERLRQLEQLKREADEAVGAARTELACHDGSGIVAILTEDLSCKRSLLATEVDRYMPLVYARHLLNTAVSRFEKENQPEMIATVSRLLSQMTGGEYVDFDRTGGGKQHVLIRRADGVERTPDQLSTGTREQLYLAIRLAYVLHYCEQNQPLPIVIDDVLVNFDDHRARQTLAVLASLSQSAQVLFFTCHNHLVDLARDVMPGLIPIELPASAARRMRP